MTFFWNVDEKNCKNDIQENYAQGLYSQNFLKQILKNFVTLGLKILRFYRPKVYFQSKYQKMVDVFSCKSKKIPIFYF